MKKENIRWIPSLLEMGRNWLESRILVDSSFFKRCCDFYYGDVTFEEAFQMTGKHVCISVSSSRAGSGDTAQRLLLNHISTPHVTISSAVAASCALPGIMKPTKLMAKDSEGNQVVFEVDRVEWSGMEHEILTERDILTELYHKTNGNEWSNKDGWLDKDRRRSHTTSR
jgi:hypothetical protein